MNSVDPNQANPYASFGDIVARSPAAERSTFIRKTYIHLTAAVYAFAAVAYAIFQMVDVDALMVKYTAIPYAHFMMLGGFMLVSWIANSWAQSNASRGMQYAGLMLYVVADAVFFVPLLWMAQQYAGPTNIIATAGVITLVIFGGLTAIVFLTGADFSFLRTALMLGGFGAIGLIVCGMIFGFDLGVFFSVAMVVFAGGYILYDTSNVLHHYRTDQYVAAALALFASVALLFWYVLRIVMSSRD